MAIKALIYCRVSSIQQVTDGTGLDSQEKRCRDHAINMGYEIKGVYREEGKSGGLFERPEMNNLLKELDKYLLESDRVVVVFDDLKRFARDTEIHFRLKKEIYGRNGRVECPNFKFEDTPEGKFVETLMAANAELERNQNKRQVIQKQKARLEMGCWPFCLPLGLKNTRSPIYGKIHSPSEPYASIYKKAIELYRDGLLLTLEEVRQFIAKESEKQGIVRRISISCTRRILTNILYAGWVEYTPWGVTLREGRGQGFISIETYRKVQERLQGRIKARLRSDYNLDFPLRRYVLCGGCGKPYTASWNKGRNKRYANYVCNQPSCRFRYKTISKEKIESEFGNLLEASQLDCGVTSLVKDVFMNVWSQQKNELIKTKENAICQATTLDNQIRSLVIRSSKTDEIIAKAYEEEIRSLMEKKGGLEKIINTGNKYTKEEFGTALQTVLDTLREPLKLWRSDCYDDKRTIIHMFFNELPKYHYNHGFGTAKIEPTISLIRESSSQNKHSVETEGIEPSSEIINLQFLQA